MTTELQEKFLDLRTSMNTHNLERTDEVDIVLTALLAKQHAVFLGPPGTAKSQMAYDVVNAFGGANIFKWLVSKYTTPEELFGPMSIQAIKQDKFRRVVDGKLPSADVAFIDEIFKGNTSILNSLLTIMNEGEFDNDGRYPVPLRTLLGASNEMPEGEELNAMFDRFHFRKQVDYIHEPGNFIRLLKGTPGDMPELSLEDLDEAYNEVAQVNVPDDILDTVYLIRQDLLTEGIVPSDRRFRQAIKSLRAYAWLNGRDVVTDDDFVILQHMLWSSPQEYKAVVRTVLQHTNEINMRANELLDEIDEIAGQAASAIANAKKDDVPADSLVTKGIEWFSKGKAILKDLNKLEQKAIQQNRPTQQVERVQNRTKSVLKLIGTKIIGLEGEAEEAANV